jgi:hypothetical protein
MLHKIVWGKPDSPRRALCAVCHGALPEVPLMLWKEDGSGASFCDDCAEVLLKSLYLHRSKAP